MKEKEDDLSLFLELRNREMGRNDLSVLQNSDEFDDSLGSKPKITATMRGQKEQTDEFLDSENDKTDYDWLLTPPCTPMFPSLEKSVMKANGNSKSQITAPRSRLAEPPVEPASRSDVKSARRTASSAGVRSSSSAGIRRPSSSGGAGSAASRPATPTGRPTLPAIAKPLRSSTPTSRATVPSNKVTAPPKRSSTPSNARSSTPTGRPSILAGSKSTPRTATPTRRPSSSSSIIPTTSAPTGRSSSVTKSSETTIKNPVPSRGNSPTVKSRPLTLLSARPNSASRERPSARPSSVETSSSGRPRQKPCSPLRGRVSSGNSQNSGRPVIVKSRKYSSPNDEVNPVLMGTQMVERVVNMRKLAPPKQDDRNSNHANSSGKSSSSQDSSGFGRSLSKKSLEMAMRHMDIRRSISGHMRTLMKDVPASSVYSVRSESTKLRTTGASDSGLATSSDASSSSEHSVNNNSCGLNGSEMEYIDLGSEGHSLFSP